MILNKISKWFSSLSTKVEKSDYVKRHNISNNEFPKHLLKIPVVGGYIYLASMYLRGIVKMNEIKQEQQKYEKVKSEIKTASKVKKSLMYSLNKFIEEDKIREVEIEGQHLSTFYKILKDFPTITAVSIDGEENKEGLTKSKDIKHFVLIKSEEVF